MTVSSDSTNTPKIARLVFIRGRGMFVVRGMLGLFCSHCGTRRQAGYQDYCAGCGYKLEHPKCTNCRGNILVNTGVATDNWDDSLYCYNCGTKLPAMTDYLVESESFARARKPK